MTFGLALLLVLLPGDVPEALRPRSAAIFAATQTGPLDVLILTAAEDFGVDPWVLKGLLLNESGLDPAMRCAWGVGVASFTPAGVRGVNRLRAKDGAGHERERFSMRQAMDPAKAIPAAAELLANGIRRYGRDAGIAAYRCPAHAPAVRRFGYQGARRRGPLYRCGTVPTSGGYLVRVLTRANELRAAAGLPALVASR